MPPLGLLFGRGKLVDPLYASPIVPYWASSAASMDSVGPITVVEYQSGNQTLFWPMIPHTTMGLVFTPQKMESFTVMLPYVLSLELPLEAQIVTLAVYVPETAGAELRLLHHHREGIRVIQRDPVPDLASR